MNKPKHNCEDCIKVDMCEWAAYSENIICDHFVDKRIRSLISELCDDYCSYCILIYKSADCADCTCARVREIIEEKEKHD